MKKLYTSMLLAICTNLYPANDHIQFIENRGQILNMDRQPCNDILFHTDAGGMSIFLKKTGLSYVFQSYPIVNQEKKELNYDLENLYINAHRVDLYFVGANTNPQIIKQNKSDALYNFYNEQASVSGVRAYEKLEYKNVYEGIDAIFYTSQPGHMKYDFIVNPGADPKNISFYYAGADNIFIDNGVLKVTTQLGVVAESIPKVYQNIDGKIVDVQTQYVLEDEIVKFKTGDYNKNYPLVIDPWVTFVGGSQYDFAYGINVDNSGNTTIIGSTNPVLFPITTGAFQTTFGGGVRDMFISKFDNSGNLVFSTLMGGSGDDIGNGVSSDAAGNIYITGYSASSGLGTAGVVHPNRAGNTDAVIAKFSPTGSRIWLTYYGGSNMDAGNSINIDLTGNVVVGGYTRGGMATTGGCFQSLYAGNQDAFLLKLNNTGTSRIFATYIGGASSEGYPVEAIADMDIDPITNDIALIGNTASANFPVSTGAYSSSNSGSSDNFIGRFNAGGSRIWLTYFGGNLGDDGYGIAFNNLGDIAFGGTTFSVNLPTTSTSFQQSRISSYSAYAGMMSGTGLLQWVTYFGNTATEGYGIAVNKNNNDVYLTGDVYFSGLYPWGCAFQSIEGTWSLSVIPPQPGEDQFIARFDVNGKYKCNTYIGGFGHDDYTGGPGGNICYYKGDVYICARSVNSYPVTPGAYQTTYGGGSSDAVIAKICGHTCGDNTVIADFVSDKDSICAGTGVNFTDMSTACDTSASKWYWTFPGGSPSTSSLKNPSIIYNAQGSYSVKLLLETPCGKDSITMNNFIYVSDPSAIINSATDVSCFGNNTGNASVGVIGGFSPFSYSWSPTTGTNNSISNLTAGNYSVTVTDLIGCTSNATVNITEPSLLIITATTTANAGCSGAAGIVSSTANGGTSPYNYSWNTIPAQLTSAATGLTTGLYAVTVTDNYGCTAIATTSVSPSTSPPITVTINPTASICIGSSIQLTAVASGGGGIYSYNWLPGNTSGNTLLVNPAVTTSYSVIVTDNCNSPSAMGVISITVNPTPEISYRINDSMGCAPVCVTFTNTTNNTNTCYWQLGDGTFSSQNSFTHCYNAPGNYSVSLLVTDNNGCSASLTKTNYITIHPKPTAAFIVNPNSITLLDPTVYFTDKSTGATTWQWSFGDVINSGSTIQNPKFAYEKEGMYVINLKVSNEFGCIDSTDETITINPAFVLYVPNSFSPNEDELNDIFKIEGIGIKEDGFELLIFDRWGNLVFTSDNIYHGWDGKINTRIAQIDTYAWKVRLKTFDGQYIRRCGHVNLIK